MPCSSCGSYRSIRNQAKGIKRNFFKAQKGVCFLRSTLFSLPFAAGTHFCNLYFRYSDVLCCRPMQNLGHGLKLLIYSEAHSDGDRFILGYFLRLFFLYSG